MDRWGGGGVKRDRRETSRSKKPDRRQGENKGRKRERVRKAERGRE